MKFLALILFVAMLGLAACSEGNSTDSSGGSKTAKASNNTILTPENTYDLTRINLYMQSTLNQIWIFVKDENTKASITIKVRNPLPSADSHTFNYISSMLDIKAGEFQISELVAKNESDETDWVTEGSALGISTTGKMYLKRNSNSTISIWTNDLKLASAASNPEHYKKFSFKFTFDASLQATNELDDYVELKSDK